MQQPSLLSTGVQSSGTWWKENGVFEVVPWLPYMCLYTHPHNTHISVKKKNKCNKTEIFSFYITKDINHFSYGPCFLSVILFSHPKQFSGSGLSLLAFVGHLMSYFSHLWSIHVLMWVPLRGALHTLEHVLGIWHNRALYVCSKENWRNLGTKSKNTVSK